MKITEDRQTLHVAGQVDVSECACVQRGQQCVVSSDEIVRLKRFVWINCILTDECVRANFLLFYVGKKQV